MRLRGLRGPRPGTTPVPRVRPSALLHLLQHALDEQRPHRGRVGVDLGEAAALGLGHELAPGHALGVRAAGEAAPVRGLGADAHRVLVARRAQVDAEAVVHDVDVRPDLLRPVARHAAADGEDAQPLRAQGEAREAVEVEVGVVAGQRAEQRHRIALRALRLRALHRPGREVEAELGVGEGGHVDGHASSGRRCAARRSRPSSSASTRPSARQTISLRELGLAAQRRPAPCARTPRRS